MKKKIKITEGIFPMPVLMVAAYDEEGKVITKSKGEYTEELYRNNVVNYLLVPEDYEVPAGLEKDYIIITVPSEKSFAASQRNGGYPS